MNAMEFWKKNGTETVKKVCEHAGTNLAYFKHIAHGRKRPSVDLAAALIAGSAIYAEEPMVMAELVKPKPHKRSRAMQPALRNATAG